MKKTMMMFLGAALAAASVGAASLADARAKIGESVSDVSVLTATIKTLSAADQVVFLREVNGAIAKMPGSVESQAATFLAANRAAIKAASGTGNVGALLAEAFATVPLEALTVLNERFAAELFNRAANPSVTYTDDKFVAIAKPMMEQIAARNRETDEAAVRDVFAVLMFVRASNGTPADLGETLLTYVPEVSRKAAKDEWMVAALAEGAEKSYAPMLDAAGAGVVEPDLGVVVRLAGPDLLSSLLSDLNNGETDASGRAAMNATGNHLRQFSDINAGFTQGGGLDHGLDRVPFNFSRKVYGTDAGTKGGGRKIGDGPVYDPETGRPIAPGGTPVGPDGKPVGPGGRPLIPDDQRDEPGGYQYQNI